jgi:hypothetical protein
MCATDSTKIIKNATKFVNNLKDNSMETTSLLYVLSFETILLFFALLYCLIREIYIKAFEYILFTIMMTLNILLWIYNR